MVSKHKYQNVTWADLAAPTTSEILGLAEEFNLPEPVAQELNQKTLRGKVDFYEKESIIYLVLHFPVVGEGPEHIEEEIDFVIGRNFVLTAHYNKSSSLNQISRELEAVVAMAKNDFPEHGGLMFIYLLRGLYHQSLEELEDINDSLKTIEKSIFKGNESKSVGIISNTNRKFLNFKQALRHHGEILHSLKNACRTIFGETFIYRLEMIDSEHNRLRNTLEIGKEILNDLRETNDSLLTTKTNQTMRTLTAMTFTLLPITLITGIFGMNVSDTALLIKDGQDFILVLLFMVIVGIIMFIWFRGKKWL